MTCNNDDGEDQCTSCVSGYSKKEGSEDDDGVFECSEDPTNNTSTIATIVVWFLLIGSITGCICCCATSCCSKRPSCCCKIVEQRQRHRGTERRTRNGGNDPALQEVQPGNPNTYLNNMNMSTNHAHNYSAPSPSNFPSNNIPPITPPATNYNSRNNNVIRGNVNYPSIS